MPRIISMHEYVLRPSRSEQDFISAVLAAKHEGMLDLPELLHHRLLYGVKGVRCGMFASLWTYEDRRTWESLWGSADAPTSNESYSLTWRMWEDDVLAPFLDRDPDTIDFTAYEELG